MFKSLIFTLSYCFFFLIPCGRDEDIKCLKGQYCYLVESSREGTRKARTDFPEERFVVEKFAFGKGIEARTNAFSV